MNKKLFVLLAFIVLMATLIGCDMMNSMMYSLTVTVEEGEGTITPNGGQYVPNNIVTFTIDPDDGYVFDHWGGPDGEDVNPNTNSLTMNNNKVIHAYFKEENPSVTDSTAEVTLNLPEVAPGMEYQIFFDSVVSGNNDLGDTPYTFTGTCGNTNTVQKTVTIPADDYYVYAFVDVNNSGTEDGPDTGDYLGVHGGSFEQFPTSPTVTVPAGQSVNVSVDLAVMQEETPTGDSTALVALRLPEAAPGKEYMLFFDDNNQVGDAPYIFTGTCGDSNIIDITETIAAGNYFAYAVVDMNDSGFDEGPDVGDYIGIHGSTDGELPAEPTVFAPADDTVIVDIYLFTETEEPNPGEGNVTIGFNLPYAAPGKEYQLIFDDDDIAENGFILEFWNVCDTYETFADTFDVPPGDYYIHATVDINETSFDEGPISGDFVGKYINPDTDENIAHVTEGDQYFEITMEEIEDGSVPNEEPNVSAHLSLGDTGLAENKEFMIYFDDDANPENGNLFSFGDFTSSTPFTSIDCEFYVEPGDYYVYAIVDMDNSGLWNGPSPGDFIGVHNGHIDNFPSEPSFTVTNEGISDFTIYMSIYEEQPNDDYNTTVELNLPYLAAGNEYQILFDLDNDPSNGCEFYFDGFCEANLSFPVNVNVPAGDYFIFTAVDMNGNGFEFGPDGEDLVGQFLTDDIEPAMPNAHVSEEGENYFPVMLAELGPQGDPNLFTSLLLPEPVTDVEYVFFIDTDLDKENGVVLEHHGYSEPYPTTTIDIDIYVEPGSYYAYALIDGNGDGLEFGPEPGDYRGLYGGAPNIDPPDPNVIVSGEGDDILIDMYEIPEMEPNASVWLHLPAAITDKYVSIIFDDNTNPDDGIFFEQGAYYSGDSVIEVPVATEPGTYFIYGAIDVNDTGLMDGPIVGDFVGFYDGTIDSPPTTATAVVLPDEYSNFDIYLEELTEDFNTGGSSMVTVHMHLPDTAPGKDFLITLSNPNTDDMYIFTGTCNESMIVDHSFEINNSGYYFLTAMVDINDSGVSDNDDWFGMYGGNMYNPPMEPNAYIPEEGSVEFDVALHANSIASD